jgi:hypothetical protein
MRTAATATSAMCACLAQASAPRPAARPNNTMAENRQKTARASASRRVSRPANATAPPTSHHVSRETGVSRGRDSIESPSVPATAQSATFSPGRPGARTT